jgi:two-component system OmpR family response regulator
MGNIVQKSHTLKENVSQHSSLSQGLYPESSSVPVTSIEKPDIHIFLVDDDILYLKLLENQLSGNQKIKITTFRTGEKCLELLSENPDVIILDYFLNGNDKTAKNGLEILIKIKQEHPNIQVLMLSAHENVEIALNCIRHDAFNFIVKNDTTFLRLKHSIKQIFSHYSKVKELVVWDW